MKYDYLAKYTNAALKKTIKQLEERTDLNDKEKDRRGNIMIEELQSRGVDYLQESIDEVMNMINKLPKKK